jgi:hypothetical protein
MAPSSCIRISSLVDGQMCLGIQAHLAIEYATENVLSNQWCQQMTKEICEVK